MYIATALHKKLPPPVRERAKTHVIDTFAAAVAGSRLLPGKRAVEYVRALGGRPEAGVLGTTIVTSRLNAALANGMFGHADETDDTHPPSLSHPGTSVVPAALAIGEARGLTGLQVLRAIVLGYDVCARVLLALQPLAFLRAGHHAGAFGQLFGAAAAAGALLDLDARQVRHMLSFAAQQAAGLATMFRDSEHVEKAYAMGGMPAHNGTQAALMVACGFTGVEDAFSGERDFFATYSPQPDRDALTRRLGEDFEVMRAAIKRWPAGGPIQAPLHVLRELIERERFTAADVEKLVVHVPDRELEIVDNREMPAISLQHLLALLLVDGDVTFDAAHNSARMKDPRVLEARRSIEAMGDPRLTNPGRRWCCAIEVRLRDGRVVRHESLAAKGSADNPLTLDEAQHKARDLMSPVLGRSRTEELLAQLRELDQQANVVSLRALYQC